MNVASLSARVAARCFAKLGSPAQYTRKADGGVVSTVAVVNRGYETSGHLGQRTLTITLLRADVAAVERGDVIAAEEERFEVQRESARDADTVTVIVRAVA